ncbi:MAG: DNA cytosine methyltransferase [Gemmatimonadetes bacterium]|nr:DNA cytosine methyltransferase [Gemmatimonadota bacterium]
MRTEMNGYDVTQTIEGSVSGHLYQGSEVHNHTDRTFIDLFAGAGCLSLGLMSAGWQGILAVEKDKMAFQTLNDNLVEAGHIYGFSWPEWYPKKQCSVGSFASKYNHKLLDLRGRVTLIAGGPPCQGFSFAGRRDKTDYRNLLFRSYMEVVRTVQPLFILLENVHGIAIEFGKGKHSKMANKIGRPSMPYSQRITRSLEKAGYHVYPGLVRAVDYGVPQLRPRYFLLAVLRTAVPSKEWCNPFDELVRLREGFLESKGLPINQPVGVKEALSDLETNNGRTWQCVDSPRFKQGKYSPAQTHYQRLMRCAKTEILPDSHRLANHRSDIVARFEDILKTCRRGMQLSKDDRERYGLKKNCVVPLDPEKPSHTLTTLPDDLLHYSEPRILTVREYARLQSIPDWFKFRGKYTTGGDRRVRECPRYTQAGNAVPPFIGEVIGILLSRLYDRLKKNGTAKITTTAGKVQYVERS